MIFLLFLKQEIKKYLVDEIAEIDEAKFVIVVDDGDNESRYSFDYDIDKIEALSINTNYSKEFITIQFLSDRLCIFVWYGGINNHEIMFLENYAKCYITTEDTDFNIVYEGDLEKKNNAEILKIVCDILKILIGSTGLKIEDEFVSRHKNNTGYCIYNYKVKVIKPNDISWIGKFDNIEFIIN